MAKRNTTSESIERASEMSSHLQRTGYLPDWMYSPPTPETPEDTGASAAPKDAVAVVACGGALYDRITLYRSHRRTLRLRSDVSPLLRTFFSLRWDRCATDAKPEHAEERARILALAAEASPGARALDLRRAWRVVDWQVRVHAPVILALAGFETYAQAYRNLSEITGPDLPRGAAQAFRAACRETDKASTIAMKRRTDEDKRKAYFYPPAAHDLEHAARTTFPELNAMLEETYKSQMTPLALGLLAKGYARICIEHDGRIRPAQVRRVQAQLDDAALALVHEVVTMPAAARRAVAA